MSNTGNYFGKLFNDTDVVIKSILIYSTNNIYIFIHKYLTVFNPIVIKYLFVSNERNVSSIFFHVNS